MKTQYYTASSLDGFIATEDDSIEWLFALGDVNETSYPEFIKGVGALAMGSAMYEWMLRYFAKTESPAAEPWPYTQPTWVFSSRALQPFPGADIRFARGDVRPVHAEMGDAAGGKNVWLVGGGDLVGQFYDAGLLDEIIVQVGSVTLGKGKPLLPRRITGAAALRLTSVRQVGPGFAELYYDVPHATERAAPDSISHMEFDPVDSLILDLLEWISARPRTYTETIEAWRTSCPKLPIWEDALDRGFVTRGHQEGRGAFVSVTGLGREFLELYRPPKRDTTT